MTTAPGAPIAVDEAAHLSHELTLGPDVLKCIRAHRKAERAAREGERRVAVATDRLASRRGETASEPDLGKIQIGQDGRG